MRAPHLSNMLEIYDLHCSKLNSSGGDTSRIVSDGWPCVVCAGPIISPAEIMPFTTAINHDSVSLDNWYPRHIWRRREWKWISVSVVLDHAAPLWGKLLMRDKPHNEIFIETRHCSKKKKEIKTLRLEMWLSHKQTTLLWHPSHWFLQEGSCCSSCVFFCSNRFVFNPNPCRHAECDPSKQLSFPWNFSLTGRL